MVCTKGYYIKYNEVSIIKWLKVCPDFEVIKTEVHPIIDGGLGKSFNGVSFAELKHFIVDTCNWSAESNLKNNR